MRCTVFYEVLMEKRAQRLEKIAVTMGDLRKAYKARVSPHLIRSTRSARKGLRSLSRKNRGGTLVFDQARAMGSAVTLSKPVLTGLSMPDVVNQSDAAVKQIRKLRPKESYAGQIERVIGGARSARDIARLKALAKNTPDKNLVILMGGDTGRILHETAPSLGLTIPKATSGKGREAANRLMGLHEAREMQAARRSYSRGDGPTFASHQGPQPMLNDVIIANTFTGKGGDSLRDQVGAMRSGELVDLKDSLSGDSRSVELIERLQSGGRINRHGRKHLDREYARRVLGRS